MDSVPIWCEFSFHKAKSLSDGDKELKLLSLEESLGERSNRRITRDQLCLDLYDGAATHVRFQSSRKQGHRCGRQHDSHGHVQRGHERRNHQWHNLYGDRARSHSRGWCRHLYRHHGDVYIDRSSRQQHLVYGHDYHRSERPSRRTAPSQLCVDFHYRAPARSDRNGPARGATTVPLNQKIAVTFNTR